MKASRFVKTEDLVLFFGDDPEADDAADDTLNVKVNPGMLTPNKEAEIRAADEDATEPIVDLLLALVIKWDLLDDKGKLIPLKKPVLMDTPIVVLAMILNGITNEFQERAKAEGKASAAS